jgi:hypothetical protein
MNSGWFTEVYFSGCLRPRTGIDPLFKRDRHVSTLSGSTRPRRQRPVGKLTSTPTSPLIALLSYRVDRYKDSGPHVLASFAAREANPITMNDPLRIYGPRQRGVLGGASVPQ